MDRSLPVLNLLLYCIPVTTQSLSFLYQVKQFFLESGSVPKKINIHPSPSLYNPPHNRPSNLNCGPSTLSEHFTTTMIDIFPSGDLLLIFNPSGSEASMCVDSCFSSSEKKPILCWIPIGDNHYSRSWSTIPWSRNLPSIRFDSFNVLPTESSQKYLLKTLL